MSSFWNGWIIILTVGNIIACYWLIRWTMRKRTGESAQGDVTGHTWDGDLQEYNNPLPRWWLYLFYITMVFAFAYLALYPGLGSFKGVLGWSSLCQTPWDDTACEQPSQWDNEMAKAAEKYDPIYQQYAAVAVTDLATQPDYQEAREMGKRLYLTYCMQCHGSEAGGVRGFPNLKDDAWLWGGSPEAIQHSIAMGRNGNMPGFSHLDDDTVSTLVSYVQHLAGRETDPAVVEQGQQAYMMAGCLGCHGADGTGNTMLGAPNLTDDAWVYGASSGYIKETILKGRNGVMPAHQELLGDNKVHLLTAYIYSLSAD